MSVLNTLPTPVVQMGLVEKIVDAQQNQPGVQQLASQSVARHELEEAKSRVAGTDAAENSKKIRDRQSGEDPSGNKRDEHRKRNAAGKDAPPAPEESTPTTKPWSGHIVNLKI